MTLDRLEARALADKRHEHEVRHGRLMVCWDEQFDYYELSPRGEPIWIDREEAIDLLNDIEFQAARSGRAA